MSCGDGREGQVYALVVAFEQLQPAAQLMAPHPKVRH
jgi:hypothetical protein